MENAVRINIKELVSKRANRAFSSCATAKKTKSYIHEKKV